MILGRFRTGLRSMGRWVGTKKDLQALQAQFNKQIADLKKSIDQLNKFSTDSVKFDEGHRLPHQIPRGLEPATR